MHTDLARRTFLKGLCACAVVLGFDPLRRSWVTASDPHCQFDELPPLDGTLSTDDASRTAAADDFGHILHRVPCAVLRPGSVADIARMVRYARRHGLHVAPRGQGHNTYGQPQVQDGIVIDMSTLNTIRSVGADRADVDAGTLWSALLLAALQRGLTPPVLTDYVELSIGGTLAVGGISGTSHHHGVQVDNVLELEVVTGAGEIAICSPEHNRDLFEAVLAGLGQCGIITRVTVRLVPAPTNARVYKLYYNDLATFTGDQRQLIANGRFDYIEGQVLEAPEHKLPGATRTWYFMLEAARYYTPPALPADASLLASLHYDRGLAIEEHTYFDFAHRLAPLVLALKAARLWSAPHPWFNVFVPASAVNQYVSAILGNLTLADTGEGPILLYPVNTARLTRPLFRVPDEAHVFLFSVLRTALSAGDVERMTQSNLDFFLSARAQGGTAYPIGTIPLTHDDWRRQFGPAWGALVSAKQRFDPDNVLTPGQGIF